MVHSTPTKRKSCPIDARGSSNKKLKMQAYPEAHSSTNVGECFLTSASQKDSFPKSPHQGAFRSGEHNATPRTLISRHRSLSIDSLPKSMRYRSLSIDSIPETNPARHRSLSIDSLQETFRHRSRSIDSAPGSVTSSPRYPSSSSPSGQASPSRSCSPMTSRIDAVVISSVCSLPVPVYRPYRHEVPETQGLEVPGESKAAGKYRPVRNLDKFTFYGHDGKYLPFSLVARCLEKGAQRTILGTGIVTRRLEDPDEGDSDIESLDIELLVSLQPLVDLWVDYDPDQSNTVWVATENGWYILNGPDPLYATFYQPFWVAHYLTWKIAKSAREYQAIKLEDFLQQLQGQEEADDATIIMGRKLVARDLKGDYTIMNKQIPYILEQLSSSSLSDADDLLETPLLQDLACRAAERGVTMEELFELNTAEPQTSLPAFTQTVTMPLVHELTTGIFLTSLLKAGKELDGKECRHKLLKSPEPPDILHPDSPTNIEWEEPLKGHPGYYGRVCLDGEQYSVGDVVMVNPGEDDVAHRAKSAVEACSRSGNALLNKVWFCKIIYMYDKCHLNASRTTEQIAHVQWYQDGAKTILQETAHPYGLFALAECVDIPVGAILGRCIVRHLKPGDREPNTYHCGFLWDADNCRFLDHDVLANQQNATDDNHPHCSCCIYNQKGPEDPTQETLIFSNVHAVVRGIHYHKNDFVYIAATPNNPYLIGQIRRFFVDEEDFLLKNTMVELTRLGRYDDVARAMEERRGLSHVRKDELRLFMTEQVETHSLSLLEGKCFVHVKDTTTPFAAGQTADHFYVDRWAKKVAIRDFTDLVAFRRRTLELCKICVNADQQEQQELQDYMECQSPLRAMELFAGAGGLSTGLEQSGFVKTRWAVEMSSGAAATFQANHPGAWVYNQDTNICLQSAIDDREGKPYTPLYSLEDQKELPPMPQRGDVDLIAGGFPCQSFSVMNYQRHKRPDDIRTTLVANMLSYVEFYQPQYVLMENVKGLLQHHIQGGLSEQTDDDDMDSERVVKMGIVKFVLRALTCLGYQAQLRVLQAADYGSPQRRERVIFWGARRSHVLPDYPLPTHVSIDCRVHALNLPTYDKLIPSQRSERACAPLRALVVADAISDLPGFEWKNPQRGNARQADGQRQDSWAELSAVSSMAGPLTGFLEPVDYATAPDTRSFNARTVERVWHVCSNVVRPQDLPRSLWTRAMQDSSVSKLEKIWRQRFSRLQWKKPFDTALTSCTPFHKGCKILHPKQKRILTARECARSQGFPDSYEFVQSEEGAKPEAWARLLDDIHKQIGNAVPVPLARVLGHSLGKALFTKWLEGRAHLKKIGQDHV